MRRVLRWAWISIPLLAGILLVTVWLLLQAAARPPEFYQLVLQAEPAALAVHGDEFEHEVLELRNESRTDGSWSAEFTADQINGWLATDLPEKFPRALPPEVHDPRVALEENGVRIAARYDDGKLSTVLSILVEPQLGAEPNQIALRVREVRAGLLPVPLGAWKDKLEGRMPDRRLLLRWSMDEGDPIALVEWGQSSPSPSEPQWQIHEISLRAGALRISGVTTQPPENDPPSPASTIPAASSETTRD